MSLTSQWHITKQDKGAKLEVLGHPLGQIRVPDQDVNNGGGSMNRSKDKIVTIKLGYLYKSKDYQHTPKALKILQLIINDNFVIDIRRKWKFNFACTLLVKIIWQW